MGGLRRSTGRRPGFAAPASADSPLGRVRLLPSSPAPHLHVMAGRRSGKTAAMAAAYGMGVARLCRPCPVCGVDLLPSEMASHAREAGDDAHLVMEVMVS